MPDISASINLVDNMTAVINRIHSAVGILCSSAMNIESSYDAAVAEAVSSIDNLMSQIDDAVDTINQENIELHVDTVDVPDIDDAVDAINQESIELQVDTVDIPEIPTPEPIEVEWNTNDLNVFTGTGIERFEQEVASTNQMLGTLANKQNQIAQKAANTNVFSGAAVSDMNSLNQRIQAVQQRIQQIEANPMNLGTDEANAELEEIRSQLNTAIELQESLNVAVDNMDVEAANTAYNKLSSTIGTTERNIRDSADEQGQFNSKIAEGNIKMESLASMAGKAVAALGGFAAIKSLVTDSMEAYNTQLNSETQLMAVLKNTADDVAGSYDDIISKASQIQSNGIYGDESMIAAGAEFATYMSDDDAITSMMDTLSNYAMGMSGGGEIDTTTMVDYATNLGKIMTGSYDAMTKKGFEFTDAQKEIIENGTDMEKALVIDEVISESWENLYQTMSDTPEGKIIQLKNRWGDITEIIGGKLYSTIISVVDLVNNNWSTVEQIASGITNALQTVISVMSTVLEIGFNVVNMFVDNWSVISPIVEGLVMALGAYLTIMALVNAVETVQKGIKIVSVAMSYAKATATGTEVAATTAETAAQLGLNTAMLACPLTWIIVMIVAVVAAIYAVCSAIAKLTGAANTGFGVLTGGISVVLAAFKNLGLGAANVFLGIGNGISAVGQNIGIAIKNGVDNAIGFLYELLAAGATTIEGLCEELNKLPFVDFDYSGITSAADEYANKAAEAYSSKEDYINVSDAFQEGYNTYDVWQDGWAEDAFDKGSAWGDGVASKITDVFDTSSFTLDDLGVDSSGYTSASDGVYDNSTADAVAGNTGDTASNTANIADSLDITNENLKYLRDAAETEAVNRFTTAEITINQTNNNNISSETDIDGMITSLTNGMNEAVETAAQGVHK